MDFDGYYIVKTDEGLVRPKYIFNKCGTINIYVFLLYRGLVYYNYQILKIFNIQFLGFQVSMFKGIYIFQVSRYLGLRISKFQCIKILENPDFRVSRCQGIQILEYPGFRVFRCHGIQILEQPGFRVSRCQGIQILKYPGFRVSYVSRYLDFRISRFQGIIGVNLSRFQSIKVIRKLFVSVMTFKVSNLQFSKVSYDIMY